MTEEDDMLKCAELKRRILQLDKKTNEALANEDFERATVLAKQRRVLHEELHVITVYNNTDKQG